MIEHAQRTYTALTYDLAWLYCLTLVYNNHKDWRMPTWDEFGDVYSSTRPFGVGWCNEDAYDDDDYETNRPDMVIPVRDI